MDEPCPAEQLSTDRILHTAVALPHPFREAFRQSTGGYGAKGFAVKKLQCALRNSAERVRLLQNCVKHRREVAGRGVDDLQYVGGRGLPLQSLITLGLALGKFSRTLSKLTLQTGYDPIGIG